MKGVMKTLVLGVSFIILSSPASPVWSQAVPRSHNSGEPSFYPIPEDVPDEGGLIGRVPPQPEKPRKPQRELPPGIIVRPGYCPKGFEEIPNGLALYNIEPIKLPGNNLPTPMYVCRQIGPIAE